jgi:hypothetical protein
MYRNLKYNTVFLVNTHFLTLSFICFDVMTKSNRYLTIFNEITLYIRIENDVIAMESNDHLKTSCTSFLKICV